MNSGSNASPSSAGALRWLFKFVFFLALFAALGLALTYGWQNLRSQNTPLDAQAAPSPTASPSAPLSGASGHADRPPAPRP